MAAVSRKVHQTALAQQSVLAWTHVFSPDAGQRRASRTRITFTPRVFRQRLTI